MKRILLTALLSVLPLTALATDVGISISVGQPGFYGRLDIGDFPPPVLVSPQPVVVVPVPVGLVRQPMYLRVPPGHQKNWRNYCSRYEACGHPVYFVQDGWYQTVYVPQYQQRNNGRGKGKGRGNGRNN